VWRSFFINLCQLSLFMSFLLQFHFCFVAQFFRFVNPLEGGRRGAGEIGGEMHEVALVREILRMVEEEGRRNGAERIERIRLRVGEFRGVVAEALDFAFRVLREGTMAATAELEVVTVPLRVVCVECGEWETRMADLCLFCPECGQEGEILNGRELEIYSLDLE